MSEDYQTLHDEEDLKNNLHDESVNGKDLSIDPIFDLIGDITKRDNMIADSIVDDIIDIINKRLNEDDEFKAKNGFLALSKVIMTLSQGLCKDKDDFLKQYDKALNLANDKIIECFYPVTNDGKIVDDNYDNDDLSLKRIIMALAMTIHVAYYRTELAGYNSLRQNLENDDWTNMINNVKDDNKRFSNN